MSEKFNLLTICGPDLIRYVEGIDLESFVNLQPGQIKELIPNAIHRIMFENRFNNFMKNNPNVLRGAETNSDELRTPINSNGIATTYNDCAAPIFEENFSLINVTSVSSATSKHITDNYLRDTDRDTIKTNIAIKTVQDIINIPNIPLKIAITKYVGKDIPMENHHRIVVGKAIVQHLMVNNFERKIAKSEFIRLAELIVQLFPFESRGKFYTPAVKGSPAQGKLYSAYQNYRTDLLAAGLIAKIDTAFGEQEEGEEEVLREQVNEKSDALKLVLENCEDFEQVKIAWIVCYNERQKFASELSTFEYMHKFPAFGLPIGYELLILDADTLYPNIQPKLSEFGSNIVEYGTILSKKKNASKELRALIVEYDETAVGLDEESTELRTLQQLTSLRLLPYLMPNPKRKLSKEEVANLFCPYFRTDRLAAEFNSKFIADNKDTTLAFKPRLYFVGDLPQPRARIYIGTNDYTQDAICGFETLFKSFIALKTPYPDQSKHLWQFIESEVFAIETAGVNQVPTEFKAHPCNLCNIKILLKKFFLNHMRQIHGQYLCDVDGCDEDFISKNRLDGHRKRCHAPSNLPSELTETKAYECDFENCDFTHKTLAGLKYHKLSHTGKTHICNVCQKAFYKSTDLKRHLWTHTGEKPFACDKCPKAYSCATKLRLHKYSHIGVKPFSCAFCEKEFTTSTGKRCHERSHTGERPYTCKLCQKTFASNTCLSTYNNSHSGKRRFECKVCHKSFKQSNHLRQHNTIHTGEKPYRCDVCGNSFAQIGHLRTHLKIHTRGKSFSCQRCQSTFAHKSQLTTDERIHTSDSVYKCDLCEKAYVEKRSLRAHVLKWHNEGASNEDINKSTSDVHERNII